MLHPWAAHRKRIRTALNRHLASAQMLAFLPAVVLAAYWIGGELLLVAAALGIPAGLAAAGTFERVALPAQREPVRDWVDLDGAARLCDGTIRDARMSGLTTGAIGFDLGGIDAAATSLGDRGAAALRDACLRRLRQNLRAGDRAHRIGDARYLVLLEPAARLDLESLLGTANRLQAALEEPMTVHDVPHYLTAAAGFCSEARLGEDATGDGLLEATLTALSEAVQSGPSAVRAWSDGLDASRTLRRVLRCEVAAALEQGQIQPWFQPQICTSTGEITGAEGLARWVHPQRGLISPLQFLDALEAGGLMARLGEIMIHSALAALSDWDRAGLAVPRVGVNLSGAELHDPTFVERLKWDLDRHDMTGDRLCIEVLETVFTDSADNAVATTVSGLKRLGCTIDLDDFGTGHASIMALHRLPIDRVKIDRGFIAGIDRSERQRRMVSGILSLAEQLGIETLAEGVESAGEHALLAQLGCDHVQGFRIARPMPAAQVPEWIFRHRQSIARPDLSRRAQ
ncbi:GGDEF domain-containing phosphodiesterase [Roseivivax sediminis]|uniref:EAL domain, c-di-GMP-specific phosphodiesterase class I (Or its enzymatically inactive variant) n=1 Tax=Roseivivax sediminis TaxID=936889 RepID=A0A1I1UHT0_9RHOB|nr:GGDEF domain-containing phosphodiesterase [Roseivivax sediminis]SFD70432.1 EAL domain, c-di-GMP-specific phosphodiesterase class I (or its enzymatically inactive variant) [Roseivivax sediminis]